MPSVSNDLHERERIAGYHIDCLYVPDPTRIELVLESTRLQTCDLLSLETVMERPGRNRYGLIKAEHPGSIFCRIQQKLLTIEIADLGMRFHHDPWTRTVDPAGPGTTQTGHSAVDEFVRVFAEVPDVSVLVLSKPIERVFGKFTIGGDLVVDLNARHSIDELRVRRYGKLGVNESLGSWAFIDISRSGLQREVRIVDVGAEVVGIDEGLVRTAANFVTDLTSRRELIPALSQGRLQVGLRLLHACPLALTV